MGRSLREIEIGDWYETPTAPEAFEVVAVDDASGTVEIQYVDGTLEDIDFESWREMEVQDSAPPSDGTGAFDLDRQDWDSDMLSANGWGDPLDEIDRLL